MTMSGSQAQHLAVDDLIEMAIREIEVAPSHRDRARKTLKGLAVSEGAGAITKKIDEARMRKEQAELWLSERRAGADVAVAPAGIAASTEFQTIDPVDPYDVKKQMWPVLRYFTDNRPHHLKWVQLVYQAIQSVPVLSEDSVRANLAAADDAYDLLKRACTVPDFHSEANQIKAVLFAEIGNICTLRAMVGNRRDVVEEAIGFYEDAATKLDRVNQPKLTGAVLFNQGVALRFYVSLVAQDLLSPHEDLVKRVSSYLTTVGARAGDADDPWSRLPVDVLQEDLQTVEKVMAVSQAALTEGDVRRVLAPSEA